MIDLGPSPHHAFTETYCPSCKVPESAGLGQHGADCTIVYPPADGYVHVLCGHCGSIERFTEPGEHTYTAHDHGDTPFNIYFDGKGGDGGPASNGNPGGRGESFTFSLTPASGAQLALVVGAAGRGGGGIGGGGRGGEASGIIR